MRSINFLKSISNNTKLRLISLLLENELCVCELEEILNVKQVNISKNLISLKEAGLVAVRREKQRGFYYLTKEFLMNSHLIEHIKELQSNEEILKMDFDNFLLHEQVKDNNVYVCNVYRKEVK